MLNLGAPALITRNAGASYVHCRVAGTHTAGRVTPDVLVGVQSRNDEADPYRTPAITALASALSLLLFNDRPRD